MNDIFIHKTGFCLLCFQIRGVNRFKYQQYIYQIKNFFLKIQKCPCLGRQRTQNGLRDSGYTSR